MRIGINLLGLLPGINGGVEIYAVSTLRALAARYPYSHFVVFVNRQGAAVKGLNASNISSVLCDFDGRSRELRYGWEQFALPRLARRNRLDLLHSPAYQGPLGCACPTVVTVPDVNFIAFRATMAWHRRTALQFFVKRAAERAARVITISQFSKDQIVRELGIPEDKVIVTYLGPGLRPAPADWDVIREKHGLDAPYLVAFAGNNHPHKNIRRLFEALSEVRSEEPLKLVIIGRLSEELQSAAAKLNGRIHALGFVDDSHIHPILGHARLCVFPSRYEGFGLPILEAQTAGVPLACSNAASIPEVAGAGAHFFDPQDTVQIASAIERCLGDPAYRTALVEAGRENVTRFSWDKTADETMAVFEQAAGHPSASGPLTGGAS